MLREKFNDNWIFVKDDGSPLMNSVHGASSVGQRVTLPHDAMIYEKKTQNAVSKTQTGFYPGGKYLYLKSFDMQTLFAEYQKLVAVIGNNAVRERIYDIAKRIGYGFPNLVSPSAYISPYAKLGWGCVILNNAVVQNGATVGNGVLINPGVEIHHDCSVGDCTLIYTNSVVRTGAKVGR